MFVILLKFSDNKANAGQYMAGHKAWIADGFDEGIFLLVGSLQPDIGGAIVAHKVTFSELQDRVKGDPFVAENVVRAEILEITPNQAAKPLEFLMA